jgi:hypothetical protein
MSLGAGRLKVAVTLAAAGRGEQTKAVALSITDPPEQAEALVGVAIGLAQTGVAPIILIWTRRRPRRQARPAVPNGGYMRWMTVRGSCTTIWRSATVSPLIGRTGHVHAPG